MYEDYFQLKTDPFRLSPDHRFGFAHDSYKKAKDYMRYAMNRAEGFVMITGSPGSGKTTLINEVIDDLSRAKVKVAMLTISQLEAEDLLRMVAFAFGLTSQAPNKAAVIQELTAFFTSNYRSGRRTLLIVDEAQDLSISAMEELRLLTNMQIDSQPLLQIFLLGQSELRDLMQDPRMVQCLQRIVAASHLETLDEKETGAYIMHRLHAAGWVGKPKVSSTLFPIIHTFSLGIPRTINLICSRLFLHAYLEQLTSIGVREIGTVLAALQHEQLIPADTPTHPIATANTFIDLRDHYPDLALTEPDAGQADMPVADQEYKGVSESASMTEETVASDVTGETASERPSSEDENIDAQQPVVSSQANFAQEIAADSAHSDTNATAAFPETKASATDGHGASDSRTDQPDTDTPPTKATVTQVPRVPLQTFATTIEDPPDSTAPRSSAALWFAALLLLFGVLGGSTVYLLQDRDAPKQADVLTDPEDEATLWVGRDSLARAKQRSPENTDSATVWTPTATSGAKDSDAKSLPSHKEPSLMSISSEDPDAAIDSYMAPMEPESSLVPATQRTLEEKPQTEPAGTTSTSLNKADARNSADSMAADHNAPGITDSNAPQFEETDEAPFTVPPPLQILFAYRSMEVDAGNALLLDDIVAALEDAPTLHARIVGIVENRGSASSDLNRRVSKSRAQIVAAYIQQRGIDAARLAVEVDTSMLDGLRTGPRPERVVEIMLQPQDDGESNNTHSP
ncbi:MAG: AAA family ATPase [Halioglobus sp.]|nr:AAA family ATPase [Halioglobus sp.]